MIKETTSRLHLFYYAYIMSFSQFLLYVSLKLISVPRKWPWNYWSHNVFFLLVVLICITCDQAAPSPQLFYIVWNNSSEFSCLERVYLQSRFFFYPFEDRDEHLCEHEQHTQMDSGCGLDFSALLKSLSQHQPDW